MEAGETKAKTNPPADNGKDFLSQRTASPRKTTCLTTPNGVILKLLPSADAPGSKIADVCIGYLTTKHPPLTANRMDYSAHVNDFDDFKNKLQSDPALQNAIKNDPVSTIQQISQRPIDTDVWIYRIVVGALGLAILTITVGVFVIMMREPVGTITTAEAKVPTILTAIGSGAIGALTGLLAPSPARQK